jgi:hypothetical protein
LVRLGDLADRLRAKNAGPFWLTLDIFFPDAGSFERARAGLTTAAVAKLYGMPTQVLKRFDIPSLNVIKISMPRPNVQGSREDRDMHASQWAWLLADLEID